MEMRERRLAIVLLDLIGSTAFVQRAGALKAAQWLQYHDRLTRSLLYKFSGREIDRSDGFMLSFESLLNAVNFALWYQDTIPPKTRLQCRIGIHWGTVIEITQSEVYTLQNAKSVELEGVAKNIAARTMSLCGAGQVLITQNAFQVLKGRQNRFTPVCTRYVCVGLYRFKGVREPQTIYAVGTRIEALQPPKGNDKCKRLGGPKKVRSRMRDRKFKEWLRWFIMKLFWLNVFWFIWLLYPAIRTPEARLINGLTFLDPYFMWLDPINRQILILIMELYQ